MAQGSIGIRSYSPHTPTEFCDGSLRQGRYAMPRSDRHARTVDSVGAGRYVARNPLRLRDSIVAARVNKSYRENAGARSRDPYRSEGIKRGQNLARNGGAWSVYGEP